MNVLKSYWRFAIVFVLTAMLVFGAATRIRAANPETLSQAPELSYKISGCLETEEQVPSQTKQLSWQHSTKHFSLQLEGQNVKLSHELSYVCCASLQLESRVEDGTISVTESNINGSCRCICEYSIEATLGPLATGTYDFKLYGIRDSQTSGQNEKALPLLFKTWFRVDAPGQ